MPLGGVFQQKLVISWARVKHWCTFWHDPRQLSTNFSMEVLSTMNNHIQAKSACPARELNPRPSAFRAVALPLSYEAGTTQQGTITKHALLLGWLLSRAANYETCIACGVTPIKSSIALFVGNTGCTRWSFPTEAGDLLGQSQALMHISQFGCVTMMVLLKSDETRTEFECPACGKHRDATRWSFPTEAGDLLGQSQALMHILTWSSPIVHELFNGSSEYNEQPYSGEKCVPCPGIEPKTFCFPCSCSTIELRGWDNSTRNNYETCIAFGGDSYSIV